jgi:putative SOS response-associated peptidase YedK
MCERFAIPDQLTAEREFLPAQTWWKFDARYNVAASQYVPAIRMHDGLSEAVMMRSGLIPAWAEGRSINEPTMCVAGESIEESHIFRSAWSNGQRCILPIAGFYTWQLTRARYRQPFFVRLNNRTVFGLAAIWDRSVSEEDDDVIESCAVVCVPPNEIMTDIANIERRMPAILMRKDYATWLQGTPAQAKSVLRPYRSEWMQAYPVSPRINSESADGADLIRATH